MKNIKIYFTLFMLVLFGVSCFEDDSNYEYNTLKRHVMCFYITGGTAYWGEPIIAYPSKVRGNYGIFKKNEVLDSTYANRLRWEYFCPKLSSDPYTPICTTMVLNMDLWKHENVVMNTNYEVLLRATDSLGNYYDYTFNIKYNYKYTGGWFVLTKEGGNSVVSLATQSGSDWTINHDLRALMGEPALGTNPTGLCGGSSSIYPDGIYVFQSPEAVALNSNTYATATTITDMFQGGNVPAGLDPITIKKVNHGSLGVIWNRDGKLYSKMFAQNKWANELFSQKTVRYNGVDMSCQFLLEGATQDFCVYDDKLHGFYGVCGAWVYQTGYVFPIKGPSGNKNLENPLPEPNDLSAFDVLHAESLGGSDGSVRSILKEKATGKIYFYQFDFSWDDFWYNDIAAANKLEFIEITGDANYFTDGTLYAFTYSDPYLFFVPESSKKDLYYMDKNTGRIALFMSLPAEITRIKFQGSSNSVLGVACKDNKLYILNVADTNFDSSDEEKITTTLDFSTYGEIVDFYKK